MESMEQTSQEQFPETHSTRPARRIRNVQRALVASQLVQNPQERMTLLNLRKSMQTQTY